LALRDLGFLLISARAGMRGFLVSSLSSGSEGLSLPLIEISGSLQVVLDDPDDDKVIECAVTGKATYIVSGDHHLLDMNEYNSIPIVRARNFIELMEAQVE